MRSQSRPSLISVCTLDDEEKNRGEGLRGVGGDQYLEVRETKDVG